MNPTCAFASLRHILIVVLMEDIFPLDLCMEVSFAVMVQAFGAFPICSVSPGPVYPLALLQVDQICKVEGCGDRNHRLDLLLLRPWLP